MADKETINWLDEMYKKRAELEHSLARLKDSLSTFTHFEKTRETRPEGEFKYLELPVKLDNFMQEIHGPISTTELTNHLLADRKVDRVTWKAVNQNMSRLLNSRVKMGKVRKLGRIQGKNRSTLWEWIN